VVPAQTVQGAMLADPSEPKRCLARRGARSAGGLRRAGAAAHVRCARHSHAGMVVGCGGLVAYEDEDAG
jgi:hypothetical protein